jgi:hypothetical protein
MLVMVECIRYGNHIELDLKASLSSYQLGVIRKLFKGDL